MYYFCRHDKGSGPFLSGIKKVLMKERLLGKTPAELKEIAISVGLPSFAGGQIARWLYVSKVKDISEMTNISKIGRESLAERYEVGRTFPIAVQELGKERLSRR